MRRFYWHGSPLKTQVENELYKIFRFWGQNIDVSDQDVFVLQYMDLNDEEGNKTNMRDPLTASQIQLGRFYHI